MNYYVKNSVIYKCEIYGGKFAEGKQPQCVLEGEFDKNLHFIKGTKTLYKVDKIEVIQVPEPIPQQQSIQSQQQLNQEQKQVGGALNGFKQIEQTQQISK